MFNLTKEVNRLQQLKHAKTHGLPYKRKPKDPEVQHIDSAIYEIQAEYESKAIPRSFHNHSLDFGRRLSKARGQKHYPGGGCHIGGYKNV